MENVANRPILMTEIAGGPERKGEADV